MRWAVHSLGSFFTGFTNVQSHIAATDTRRFAPAFALLAKCVFSTFDVNVIACLNLGQLIRNDIAAHDIHIIASIQIHHHAIHTAGIVSYHIGNTLPHGFRRTECAFFLGVEIIFTELGVLRGFNIDVILGSNVHNAQLTADIAASNVHIIARSEYHITFGLNITANFLGASIFVISILTLNHIHVLMSGQAAYG